MPLQQSDNVDQDHFHEAYVTYTDKAGKEQSIFFDAVTAEDWNPNATVTEHPVEDGANIADHVRVGLMKCTLKVHVSVEPMGSNWMSDPVTPPLLIEWPQWFNNLEINGRILQLAGVTSEVVGETVQRAQDATSLGTLVARAMQQVRVITANGNQVPGIDTSNALVVAGQAASSIPEVASNLVFEAVADFQVPGIGVNIPVAVGPVLQSVTFTDYAAVMIQTFVSLMSSATLFVVSGSKLEQPNMILTDMSVHRGEITETGTGATIEMQFKQVRIISTNTVAAPLPAIPRAQPTIVKGQQDPTDGAANVQKSVAAYGADNLGGLLKNVAAAIGGG